MADDQQKKSTADPQKHSSIPRRSLFGTERSEDTDEWLRDLEKKNLEEKVNKWNFDFREGKPQENNPNVPSPSHVYEAIDAKEVPAFYRTKTELAIIDHAKQSFSPPAATAIVNVKSRKRKLEEKAESEEDSGDVALILRREEKASIWTSPSAGKKVRSKEEEQEQDNKSQHEGGAMATTPKKAKKEAKVKEKT